MKLHLPSTLRKALLACLAAFALPVSLPVTIGTGALISFLASQQAEAAVLTHYTTTYNGVTYSGKIFTVSENASFHEALFTQLVAADGDQGTAGPFHGMDNKCDDDSDTAASNAFYFWKNVWCNNANASNNRSRYGNTLRFDGTDITTYNFTFSPLILGGVITARNSAEYVINGSGGANGRELRLEANSAAGAVNFTLESSLRVRSDNEQNGVFLSNVNLAVASGKSLTFENYNVRTENGKSITASRLGSAGGDASVVHFSKNVTISDGGTLTVNAGVDLTIDGTLNSASATVNGGALTLGNIADTSTLTVNDGGSLQFSNGITFEDARKLIINEGSSLTFNSEATINGKNSLTFGRSAKLTFNDISTLGREVSLTATNADGSITFNGAATVNGSLAVRQGGSIIFNDTARLTGSSELTNNNGGSLIFKGHAEILGTADLMLGENATLELHNGARLGADTRLNLTSGRMLVAGTVDARESVINYRNGSTLIIDVRRSGVLQISDKTLVGQSGSDVLTILLENATFRSGWSYNLFVDSYVDPSKVVFDTSSFIRGISLVLKEDGVVSLNGEQKAAEIQWQGNGAGMVWENGTTGWITDDNDKRFHPTDSVTFVGSDTVAIDKELNVGYMRVEGNYVFTGGGSVDIQGADGLIVRENASATIEDVVINTTKVEVEGGGSLLISGTTDLTARNGMHLNSGAMATITSSGNKGFAGTVTTKGVTIDEGATLRVEDISHWLGYVAGEGTVELANGGTDALQGDGGFNTLTDGHLGEMIRGVENIHTVRLANNTLLQFTSTSDEQRDRLNSIEEIEVTEGSVFAWRTGTNSSLGTADTLIKLAGEGELSNGETTGKGALQIGVFLNSAQTPITYTMNSKVELAGDATVYVHGVSTEETTCLHTANFTNEYTSNGHTLKKTGLGTLTFTEGFHTAENQSGRLEIQAGTLQFSYEAGEALARQDVWIFGSSTSHGTLELGGQASSYTIGALSGNGVLTRADGVESTELRFVNTYEERNANNNYLGELDPNIIMHVMGGYQAFDQKNAYGELTMMASHGGTLDLEELRLSGEGYALHLTAGTQKQGDTEGTAGTLKLNGYNSSIGTTMDITLFSGSELHMTNATIIGAYDAGVPTFTLNATASKADLSGLTVNGDIESPTTVSISLKDGSELRMPASTMDEHVTLYITADGSQADLSRLQSTNRLVINPPRDLDADSDDIPQPDLTNGAVLNLSNSELGTNTQITLSAEQSTISLSSSTLGENSAINLTLTDGSTADLSNIWMDAQCYVSITATDSNTSLKGAEFDLIPRDVNDDNMVKGGVITLDVSGGTHDYSGITFGEEVGFNLTVRDNARVKLENTTPATGLQVVIYGNDAVLEDIQVGLDSRIEVLNNALNLAGNNIIHMSPELSKEGHRIFSNLTLNLLEGAKLTVDATNILPDVLAEVGKERTYYIADGDLTTWRDKLSFGAELALLNVSVSLGADGSITFRALEVAPDTVYISSRDNVGSDKKTWNNWGGDIYASTDEKTAIYMDRETTIDLRGRTMGLKEDGLVLKNLYGTEGAHLYVQGDGSGRSMITLNNNFSDVSITEMEDAINRSNEPEDRIKLDHEHFTTFNGNMTIEGADIQIRHRDGDTGTASASSTSLINGVMKLRDGKLVMTSGKLELAAAGNDLGRVGTTFAGHDAQLVLGGDTTMGGEITVISPGVLGEVGREEHILLSNEQATLTLADGTRVNTGVTIGNAFAKVGEDEEDPELTIDDEQPRAELDWEDDELLTEQPTLEPRKPLLAGTLSAAAGTQKMEVGTRLTNMTLNLEAGSVLTIVGIGEQDPLPEEEAAIAPQADEAPIPAGSDWQLAGLTGEGKLRSTVEHTGGIEICVAGGDKHFSGDLSEYQGTMVVVGSSETQFFDGVTGGKNWNLTNAEGGHVELNLMGGSQPNALTMGALNLKSGSTTTILFNMKESSHVYLKLQSLNIEDGADVTLGQFKGTISLQGRDGEKIRRLLGTINVADKDSTHIGADVVWHLRGIRNASIKDVYVNEDGDVYLEGSIDNTNRFATYARSENAAVGAGLIWGIQNTYEQGGDLAAIDALLYSLLIEQEKPTEGDIAKANHVMAAIAGASTAVMGSAVSTDMERQLRAIRNRTTALSYSGDSYAKLHSSLWINAESNYHKQDSDSTMPGYKVNGWGGTVGAHTQVTPTATVGVALTAMYNDLESVGGADSLKGDMDTYYLTGFAQVAHEAWRHTFVMSISKAELDVNRSVNYGEGSYTTKGSTDGLAFGFLYEVGYTMPLNIDYSVCLQPVFNVAWRVGQVGAYTETGATNAGLHVEEQTFNAITFGVGARVQAAFGSRIWNRTGLLEGRALLKADVGDRQGESSVSLQNAGLYRGTVKAAEVGAVGVELGAGVTVPTGRRGEVFADFSAELRADYTNLNAALGYKISF